jgi:hypothetical protein
MVLHRGVGVRHPAEISDVLRMRSRTLFLLLSLWLWFPTAGRAEGQSIAPDSPAPEALAVTNPGFECSQGYHQQSQIDGLVPDGWTAVVLAGQPKLNSARIEFAGSCEGAGFVERLADDDSMVVLSEDIESPPEPGKPFDVALYQQVSVVPGSEYSLSGWMVSLCGGSAMPNDCPSGVYISKMLGLDPTGGVDPQAETVDWVADMRNFTESRWANLRVGVVAESSNLTLFVRILSPFRWHGAHAFVDAISLMPAPTAGFVGLAGKVGFAATDALISWSGGLPDEIASVPGGNYGLLVDLQYRQGSDSAWENLLVGSTQRSVGFTIDGCRAPFTYTLRVRARAEQPVGVPGAWPNHRYTGVWRESGPLTFNTTTSCIPRAYLPLP